MFFSVLSFILWNNHLQISLLRKIIFHHLPFDATLNELNFYSLSVLSPRSKYSWSISLKSRWISRRTIYKYFLEKSSFFAVLFRFQTNLIWNSISVQISNIFPNLYVSFAHFIYPFYYLCCKRSLPFSLDQQFETQFLFVQYLPSYDRQMAPVNRSHFQPLESRRISKNNSQMFPEAKETGNHLLFLNERRRRTLTWTIVSHRADLLLAAVVDDKFVNCLWRTASTYKIGHLRGFHLLAESAPASKWNLIYFSLDPGWSR